MAHPTERSDNGRAHYLITLREPDHTFTGTAGVPPALSEAKTVARITLLPYENQTTPLLGLRADPNTQVTPFPEDIDGNGNVFASLSAGGDSRGPSKQAVWFLESVEAT